MKKLLILLTAFCIIAGILLPDAGLESANIAANVILHGKKIVSHFFVVYSFSVDRVSGMFTESRRDPSGKTNDKKENLPKKENNQQAIPMSFSMDTDGARCQGVKLRAGPISSKTAQSCGYSALCFLADTVPKNRGSTGVPCPIHIFLAVLLTLSVLPRGSIDGYVMNFAYIRDRSRL